MGSLKKDQVQLIPKTAKGKNVCNNHGHIWDVDRRAAEQLHPAPSKNRLCIRSLNGKDMRWVHLKDDPNFHVSVPDIICGMHLN
jgi:hypothetical protein